MNTGKAYMCPTHIRCNKKEERGLNCEKWRITTHSYWALQLKETPHS